MSKNIRTSQPVRKPVLALTFTAMIALEESKALGRALSRRELERSRRDGGRGLYLKMRQGERNAYYRACIEELGIDVPGHYFGTQQDAAVDVEGTQIHAFA